MVTAFTDKTEPISSRSVRRKAFLRSLEFALCESIALVSSHFGTLLVSSKYIGASDGLIRFNLLSIHSATTVSLFIIKKSMNLTSFENIIAYRQRKRNI